MKILIAVSNNRSDLNVQFVRCIIELLSYTGSKGHQVALTFFDNYDISTMRNHAVESGLTQGVDYVFFLDADQIYPYDSIVKLLAHGKEVVQGFYVTRKQPTLPVHFKEIKLDGHLGDEDNRIPCTQGLVEQACGGFGGVLVATSVLQKMKYPYFKLYYDDAKNLLLGEDIHFFMELQKLGIKSYLDCDLKFGHIVNGAIYPDGNVRII